jgi:hypothetical protein
MHRDWSLICSPKQDDLVYDEDGIPDALSTATLVEAWADDSQARNIVVYFTDGTYHVGRAWTTYVELSIVESTESAAVAKGVIKGLQTSWDGVTAFSADGDYPQASDVEFCPFCLNSPNKFDDPDALGSMSRCAEEHQQFNHECPQCGGWFSTPLRSGPHKSPYDSWTLLFVPEKDEGGSISDINAVKVLQTDDEDAIKVARAEFNTLFGGCSEIYGVDWAIRDFYQLITTHYNFDSYNEGRVGDWLPRPESEDGQ